MTVSELISHLREMIRDGHIDGDAPVVIYDCHDPDADGIELEPQHIEDTVDEDDIPYLLISNLNDPD